MVQAFQTFTFLDNWESFWNLSSVTYQLLGEFRFALSTIFFSLFNMVMGKLLSEGTYSHTNFLLSSWLELVIHLRTLLHFIDHSHQTGRGKSWYIFMSNLANACLWNFHFFIQQHRPMLRLKSQTCFEHELKKIHYVLMNSLIMSTI